MVREKMSHHLSVLKSTYIMFKIYPKANHTTLLLLKYHTYNQSEENKRFCMKTNYNKNSVHKDGDFVMYNIHTSYNYKV